MGQKTHPIGFRLGITKPWRSQWYANREMPQLLKEDALLRKAAEEAQRERDMFAKVPKRSYSNLNRTRSGLLSQLLNPDNLRTTHSPIFRLRPSRFRPPPRSLAYPARPV